MPGEEPLNFAGAILDSVFIAAAAGAASFLVATAATEELPFLTAAASTVLFAALEMALENEDEELPSDSTSALTSVEKEEDVEVSMTRPLSLKSPWFSSPE